VEAKCSRVPVALDVTYHMNPSKMPGWHYQAKVELSASQR